MTRNDFQRISKLRVREAVALLHSGHPQGAYYLAGYAVECAIKACIAKQTKRYDFPNKDAKDAWQHRLESLLRIAGLAGELETEISSNKSLERNWALVKDWSVDSRYRTDIAEDDARELLSACRDRMHGVLAWIKRRW